MEEKTKTSWEHFYNYLFTIKRGKACGTGKRFIRYVMQGEDERGVGCDNFTSNLQKRTQCRLDARLIKATITTIKILYRGLSNGQAPTHSDTHSDKINPMKRKALLQPGREGVEVTDFGT